MGWREDRLRIAEAIPAAIPRIIDGQRKKVLAVEDRLPAWRMATRELESMLADLHAVADLNGKTAYHHGRIQLEQRPRFLHVLHALAHGNVDPVFPEHGAEWCEEMLRTVADVDDGIATRLGRAFREAGIRVVPRDNRIALKRCRGIASNQPGSAVRVVLDDPPEEVVAVLLGWSGDGCIAYTGTGEALLEPERIPGAVALLDGPNPSETV
jgi:hypothetical protein